MFRLVRTASFDPGLRRFVRQHQDLCERVAQVLEALEADPFPPQLRLRPLRAELRACTQ